MKILNPQTDLDAFFDRLKKSKQRILLLDYDGTLAPFRKERNKARPYPGVSGILDRIIQDLSTKIVIISGRGISDLVPLLGLKRLPEIWGSHGGERLLQDGSYRIEDSDQSVSKISDFITNRLIEKGWGEMAEVKPLGLAIHWRGLNQDRISTIAREIKEWSGQWLKDGKIQLHEFDGGLELRPKGITKKQAIQTIMNEAEDEAVSAYLGDDLTDEDAFRIMKNYGLSVLVRDELRQTAADLWLRPPEELLEFLTHWY